MAIEQHLLYTKDHEWVAEPAGPICRIGITDYATNALGDVVFLQLPAVGETVSAGGACGEIESTKSVSELFAPVSGVVSAVNQAAVDDPALVNADPYGAGWLIEIEIAQPNPGLLDATAYAALTDQ